MKTNNATKWKYLLFFGIGSLVVGLSLLAFGAAIGGVEGIKDNTKATKEVRTFDNVKNLDINSFYNITVKSGDVDKVTVTYYTHKKFRPKAQLNQSGDTLSVRQEIPNTFVTGFMEIGGYLLNERTGNEDYTETIITVPKNLVIENLNAHLNFHNSQLIDLNIKNINLNGTSYLENVTAESGKINIYSSHIYNSHLKNITFETGFENLNINNTMIENSQFNDFHGYMYAENSHFKNTTFNATQVDIPETDEDDGLEGEYWYDQDGNALYGNLELYKVTLENITYNGAGNIRSSDLSLKGKANFSGTGLVIDFKLTPDSLNTTSMDFATSHSMITLGKELLETANFTTKNDESSYHKKIDNAKADLIIKSEHGHISINQ